MLGPGTGFPGDGAFLVVGDIDAFVAGDDVAGGVVDILNGGVLTVTSTGPSPGITIGRDDGTGPAADGIINVSGTGSQLLLQGNAASLVVGRDGGDGRLIVDNNGYVESTYLNVGLRGGTGFMSLTDSELVLTGVGGPGSGSNVGQAAFLSVARGVDGGGDAAAGTLNISGSTVTITSGGVVPTIGPGMQVGGSFGTAQGTGTITIDEGSSVDIINDGLDFAYVNVGRNFGDGTLNILGGSSVTLTGQQTLIRVGFEGGDGTLNLAQGSDLTSLFLNVGRSGGTGQMVVGVDDDVTTAGDAATLTLTGVAGPGTSNAGQGAVFFVGRGTDTTGAPAVGDAKILDGSTVTITSGAAALSAGEGPALVIGGSQIFPDGTGAMTVDGSTVAVDGDFARFHVGREMGTGTLDVVNGGTVRLTDTVGAENSVGLVGQHVGANGTVLVSGGTSLLDAGTLLRLGHGEETAGQSATVTVQDNATIAADDINVVAGGLLKGNGGNVTGRLNIAGGTVAPGASIGTMAVAGAFLMDAGVLEIEIDGSAGGATLSGDLITVGGVDGSATVNAGTLHVIFSGDAPTTGSQHTFLTATGGTTITDIDSVGLATTGIAIDAGVDGVLGRSDLLAVADVTDTGSALTFEALANLSTAGVQPDTTYFFGGNVGDFFDGGPGDDLLKGGAGADVLKGGPGNDTLGGGPGNDILIGGPGSDTVGYGTSTSGVQVNLTGGDIEITTGPFGPRPYIWASEGFASDGFGGTDTLFTVENVIGSPNDDVILGNNLDNELRGNLGNDLLMGNPGADTIFGGGGADRLFGGEGDDTLTGGADNDFFYVFAGDGDDIITDFTAGVETEDVIWLVDPGITDFATLLANATDDDTDTTITLSDGGTLVLQGVADTLDLDATDFVFASAPPGTAGNDVIIGTAGDDNPINGLGGNDLIFGAGGNDFILGGDGDDILLGGPDSIGNSFVGGPGNDIIDGGVGIGSFNSVIYSGEGGGAGVTVDLGLGIATDSFGDTDILKNISTVRSTNLDDTIFGGSRDAFEDFRPLNGADFVDGRGGVDRITYSSDAGFDGSGGVTVDLGAGTATDGFGASDTLSNIEFVRGTNQIDTLTGGDTAAGLNADLFIFGRLGTTFERFEGIGGNDIINGGAGVDLVAYHNDQFFGGTVGVNLTFTGGGAGGGTGTQTTNDTDTFTGIEGVIGSVFADTFNGSDANEFFQGMADDDTINGGGGIDTVSYNFEAYIPDFSGTWGAAGVTVDLSAAGGNATDSYGDTDTLSGIENVVGTIFNDTITGDANNNLLDGADGADTLTGGGGADIFAYRLPTDGATIDTNTTHGTVAGDSLTDFVTGVDRIVLDFDAFGLSEGALVDGTNFEVIGSEYDGTNGTSSEFLAGNATVIRDSTGALIYDADGAAGPGYTVLVDSGADTVQASDVVSQQTL